MSQHSDEMKPLADALRELAPVVPAMSRDRLLFEAGRASALSRWAWIWKVGTLLFAGTTIGLAYALIAWVPQTVIVERERIVEVPSVGITPPAEPPPPVVAPKISSPSPVDPETIAMWKLRTEVLRWGPEMLPHSRATPMPKTDDSKELEQWLGVPLGTFTAPYTTSGLIPKSEKED